MDKKLGEKRKTQTKGTEEINAQISLAIVTGLSQLTMVDLRKEKNGCTGEGGKKRGKGEGVRRKNGEFIKHS